MLIFNPVCGPARFLKPFRHVFLNLNTYKVKKDLAGKQQNISCLKSIN
jgi:hypothetical protein